MEFLENQVIIANYNLRLLRPLRQTQGSRNDILFFCIVIIQLDWIIHNPGLDFLTGFNMLRYDKTIYQRNQTAGF